MRSRCRPRDIAPALCRRAGIRHFRQHAERRDVQSRAFGRHLLEALVVDVVDKADGPRALGDARRLVIGRIGDAAPEPGGLVAVLVVGEGGAERAAADAGDGMGQRRSGRRIAVIADVGNPLSRSDANSNMSESFAYDGLNRLTSATVSMTPSKTFSYDAIGNLMSKLPPAHSFKIWSPC
jgi:hypothetical protein